jgi:hypothetical protein
MDIDFTDLSEGQAFLKLLDSFNLGIIKVVREDYLKSDKSISSSTFPIEYKCIEYRVYLGKIDDPKELMESYGYDSLEDLKNEKNIKDKKDFKKEYKNIIDRIPKESNQKLQFSVFFNKVLSQKYLKSEFCDEECCEQAFYYFRLLMGSFPDIYKNPLNIDTYDALTCEIDNFKNLLKNSDVEITTDTLELAKNLAYRLYKDTKFFYELEEELGEKNYKIFIEFFEWIVENI